MPYKAFDLSGRVVVITGGNGGIGLGMAEGLCQARAEVCVWGSNADKNARALEQLAEIGPRVTVQQCDIRSESQVEACFARTLADHGRVDGCFANAGVAGLGTRFEKTTIDEWEEVIRVNQTGVFFTFRAAARHMKERAQQGDAFGRLVGTSSLAANSGLPTGEHYAAAKGGMVAMIKALATEYARYGVTANAIMPGYVETDMTAVALGERVVIERILPRIPVRRWGKPEDFAAIAIYIMSMASSYHTADTFLIDGGYSVF